MNQEVRASRSKNRLLVDDSEVSQRAQDLLLQAGIAFELHRNAEHNSLRRPSFHYNDHWYEDLYEIQCLIDRVQAGTMTSNVNADVLGSQCARAVPGTSIVEWQRMFREVRDNRTVRSIVREWMRRLETTP